MEKIDISFISGVFECDDAHELLLCLINQKIQYHQLKHFSIQERFGTNDVASQSRTKELAHARLDVMAYLESAKALGCSLSIQSTISIRMLPKAV